MSVLWFQWIDTFSAFSDTVMNKYIFKLSVLCPVLNFGVLY